MRRRSFFAIVTQALIAAGFWPARTRSAIPAERLHLQDCTIAGSHQYYCPAVLADLRVSDPLVLCRESANRHDERVVAVWWKRHKLGYLPRRDNAAAASLFGRGYALLADVIGIGDQGEAWEPVRLRVWAALHGDEA